MTALNQTLESPQDTTGQSLAASPCSLFLGDCLEAMKNLPAQSVDAIITDLPYGTTACKWDAVIPFTPMWEQVRRVLKTNGVFVTSASQPFTTALIASNLEWFKYEWIWEKSKGCNFTHAKNMPIKFHESVVVFSGGKIGHACQLGTRRMTYNPQGLVKVDRPWSRPKKYENGHKLKRESHSLERIIEFEGYPRSLIKIGNSDNRERGAHPTQKPLELMRYMVRTYTNPGDVVLDPCMGSGTTCLAAKMEGRGYIGIEREPKYFETAKTRIEGDADLFSANAEVCQPEGGEKL